MLQFILFIANIYLLLKKGFNKHEIAIVKIDILYFLKEAEDAAPSLVQGALGIPLVLL